MASPPDQFQRRTYVRLPFTDRYLAQDVERPVSEELSRALSRPWLTVKISESIVKSIHQSDVTGSWSAIPAGESKAQASSEE